MKRMKNYWDELHPELSHFSDKNLRDQATRVQKRRVAVLNENQNPAIARELVTQEIIENITDELQRNNDPNIAPVETQLNNIVDGNIGEDELNILRAKFKTNYELYIIKELSERVNIINKKPIDKKLLSSID